MMLDDDGFTFAAVSPLSVANGVGGGGGGGVFLSGGRTVGALYYPVFGRPRSPPRPPPEPEAATATARVPLAQLLLADRDPPAPVPQPPADVDELDSVPAELYCPWSPGWSSAASPAPRCRKSSSTGSSFLRWRPSRLVGRSQSDGKEKFVFFGTTTSGASSASSRRNNNNNNKVRNGAGEGGHAWSYYAKGGGGARRTTTFLPYKQDLVGLFANAAMFRRSYHPF